MKAASLPISDGARRRAEDFLRKVLADGPVQSTIVHRKARSIGIPPRTLEAAKVNVARSFRPDDGDSADRSGWFMELVYVEDSAPGTDAF